MNNDPNFPAGWPDGIDAALEAAHFSAPHAATKRSAAVPLFPALPAGGNATLKLDDARLGSAGLQQMVNIDATGKITVVPSGHDLDKVRLALIRGTCLVSGSFLEPGSPNPELRFIHGAVLQKANRAGGFFLAPRGGSLQLLPSPP